MATYPEVAEVLGTSDISATESTHVYAMTAEVEGVSDVAPGQPGTDPYTFLPFDSFSDAVESSERRALIKLGVDFTQAGTLRPQTVDDLSPFVVSLDLDRTLSGDLPEEVRLVEGSAVAALSADLSYFDPNDDSHDSTWYFSKFSTESPLAPYRKLWQRVLLQVGFDTINGPVFHPRMTGYTRSFNVAAGQDTRMTAIDSRALMRNGVVLPAIFANEPFITASREPKRPGLESSFLVSNTLYQSGFVLSPQPRASVVLYVPFHGSAFPFIGNTDPLIYAYQGTHWFTGSGPKDPVKFDTGPFFLGTARPPESTVTKVSMLTDDGSINLFNTVSKPRLILECFLRIRPSGNNKAEFLMKPTTGSTSEVTVYVDRDLSINATVSVERSTGTNTQTATSTLTWPSDEQWHRLWVLVDSTGNVVRFRVDESDRDDVALAALPGSDVALGSHQERVDMRHEDGAQMAELQIISSIAAVLPSNVGSMTVPEKVIVDRSVSTLVGNPYTTRQEAWDVLTDLAQAEQAIVYFDEQGRFNWRTRERLVQQPAQNVQFELTADKTLLELGSEEHADQIRNTVNVSYSPVTYTSRGEVFAATEIIQLMPNESITVISGGKGSFLGGFIIDVSISTTETGSNIVATESNFGDYITVGIGRIDADTIEMTITNLGGSTLYFVDATGAPLFRILSDLVSTSEETASVTATVPSDTYGDFQLNVDPGRFVQEFGVADVLATALAIELSDPQPTLNNIEIAGDPRIRIGDRVRIRDRNHTALDGDYWIMGVRDNFASTGEYTQTISARLAADLFILDSSLLNSTDMLS